MLIRLRQDPVAVMVDIQTMFHQVLVSSPRCEKFAMRRKVEYHRHEVSPDVANSVLKNVELIVEFNGSQACG